MAWSSNTNHPMDCTCSTTGNTPADAESHSYRAASAINAVGSIALGPTRTVLRKWPLRGGRVEPRIPGIGPELSNGVFQKQLCFRQGAIRMIDDMLRRRYRAFRDLNTKAGTRVTQSLDGGVAWSRPTPLARGVERPRFLPFSRALAEAAAPGDWTSSANRCEGSLPGCIETALADPDPIMVRGFRAQVGNAQAVSIIAEFKGPVQAPPAPCCSVTSHTPHPPGLARDSQWSPAVTSRHPRATVPRHLPLGTHGAV